MKTKIASASVNVEIREKRVIFVMRMRQIQFSQGEGNKIAYTK